MLDGEESVQIACGKLRLKGARQHAGRDDAVEIAWGNFAGREQDSMLHGDENCGNSLRRALLGGSARGWDSMLDGEETVQIACGELRWKGTRQLDGWETVKIACGELHWEGARQHAGRRENRGNSLGKVRWEGARQHVGRRRNRANSLRKALLGGRETACCTERKPWK